MRFVMLISSLYLFVIKVEKKHIM